MFSEGGGERMIEFECSICGKWVGVFDFREHVISHESDYYNSLKDLKEKAEEYREAFLAV